MTISEKEWFIEAPWGRLCIVAWGYCYDPPVLLCHGHKDTIVSFRPLIQNLPKNFYYIGVELPGCGKSDPFPAGLLMSYYDLAYCLEVVVKHFRWETVVFLGHSAGATIGMLYNFCVPGKMTRLILLDPAPLSVDPDAFARWYKGSYQKLFDEYDYYNTQKERRPSYTRKEALKKLLKVDGMTAELAVDTLARVAEEHAGLYRFTFDQRYDIVPMAPITPDRLKRLSQATAAQVFIVATSQLEHRYSQVPFLLDESGYSNGYRVRRVDAHHNIHLSPPETVVNWVSQYLINGPLGLESKAKL